MSELIDKRQWDVHAAYRLGWETRVTYYERLLRSIIEMLQDAQNFMQIDDIPDVNRSLERVLLELEDTWTMVSLWKTAELARRAGQQLPKRSVRDPNRAS
ncbi:MAG TPA: hypothetical protein VJY65_11205 [Chloroflexota bacterium]|nr:hypothetical protein [Chloroflexota bacterium]